MVLARGLIANSPAKPKRLNIRAVQILIFFVVLAAVTSIIISENVLQQYFSLPRNWINYGKSPPRMLDLTPLLDNPEAFEEMFGEQVIFYIDALGSEKLKFRDICSLESVATFNPEAALIIVLTKHTQQGFSYLDDPAFSDLMNNSQNLYLATANVSDIAKGTFLEEFMRSEMLLTSEFLPAHTSDFVRFLLLWKLGGVYMDFDILWFKSLSPIFKLKNFLSPTRVNGLNNAFMGFERGHPLLFNLMHASATGYYNLYYPTVPLTMTYVFENFFNISFFDGENHEGQYENLINILSYQAIYPFDYDDVAQIFNASTSLDYIEKVFETSFGIHTWSRQTDPVKVDPNSSVPFAVAARKFCPRTMEFADSLI